MLRSGGGPLIEAFIVCIRSRPGVRPWGPPPRNLGGPPEGGGPGGGWFEKSFGAWVSGLSALSSAMLSPPSFPIAAACLFAALC